MKPLPLRKEVHWVLWCQISCIQNLTDISNCLGDIISCPQIDLTLPAGWLVGFVALRPKSTAMVIAGWSVHLTTLFPGQA